MRQIELEDSALARIANYKSVDIYKLPAEELINLAVEMFTLSSSIYKDILGCTDTVEGLCLRYVLLGLIGNPSQEFSPFLLSYNTSFKPVPELALNRVFLFLKRKD